MLATGAAGSGLTGRFGMVADSSSLHASCKHLDADFVSRRKALHSEASVNTGASAWMKNQQTAASKYAPAMLSSAVSHVPVLAF